MPYLQHSNQAKLISDVDLLVRDVLFGDIDINHVSIQLSNLYLPLIKEDNSKLKYSPTIEAFRESTKKVMDHPYAKNKGWGYYNLKYFMDCLYVYRESILSDDKELSRREENHRKAFEANLRKLFRKHSRLLFIRVDIGYLKDILHLVTIEDFYRHLKKLRDFIGNKKTCFEHLVGHAMALEQGYEHGYHCHLLLIYNGANRRQDSYIGQVVGEKWQSITEGFGSYYNCNNSEYKRAYEERGKLGIGMISRKNPEEVENAINTASYLNNPDKIDRCMGRLNQRLKVRPHGNNTFTHGIVEG